MIRHFYTYSFVNGELISSFISVSEDDDDDDEDECRSACPRPHEPELVLNQFSAFRRVVLVLCIHLDSFCLIIWVSGR